MNFEKIKAYIVTLNFVFIIIGYEFTTSVFMPIVGGFNASSSQVVTIPYRAVALGLSLLAIFWGLLDFNKVKRLNAYIISLLIFLFIYGIRIIYDNSNGLAGANPKTINIAYFAMLVPSVLSIVLSYERIDFKKALYGILALGTISLSLSFLFASESTSEYSRMDGNLALNTISYGHLGVTIFICSMFTVLKVKTNILLKIIFLAISLFAFYTAFRAGSRGPVVTLMLVSLFYIASIYKNVILAIIPTLLSLALVYMFRENILDFIHTFSPITASRLELLFEGDATGREFLYIDAFNFFLENPILGGGYLCNGGYPHNIVLDGLIGLGIWGGLFIVFILSTTSYFSYRALSFNIEYSWIALLCVQQMSAHMFSGSLYGASKIMSLITLCLLIFKDIKASPIQALEPLPPRMPPHMHRISYY